MISMQHLSGFNNVPRIFSFALLLLIIPWSAYAKEIISIQTQSEFNNIQTILTTLIDKGEQDIYLTIITGVYFESDNNINLSGIGAPKSNIHIIGSDAILMPSGKEYRNGDRYAGVFSPENSWMTGDKDINIWSHVRSADGLVDVVSEKDKLCRLKSKELLHDGLDVSNAYILLTHWYQSSVYKIVKIEKGFIYFTATDLKDGYQKGYNVNDDYNYAGLYPRYKLCNVEIDEDYFRIIDGRVILPSGVSDVREGTTDRIITISNCKFRSVEIAGLSFYGNSNMRNTAAINISNTESNSFRIHDCNFVGFRSNVLTINSSPNVTVENNAFSDCYLYGIRSENGSNRTHVEGNTFVSMGKRLTNSFGVVCKGGDFRVTNNTFIDFGYGGIGAGVWYKAEMKDKCFGFINGNVLSYSKNYLEDIANHAIMDSGAIYLWTKSDGIEVRNNYIHDIDGLKTNQGIFCDDGAYNFRIIGNVITGISNSNCIGSRRDSRLENFDKSGSVRSNMNNVVKDNIVDGRILFVGNELAANGCIVGDNYVLLEKGATKPKHNIKNVTERGNIIILNNAELGQGRISVSRTSYRQLKNNSEWGKIKGLFNRKDKVQ